MILYTVGDYPKAVASPNLSLQAEQRKKVSDTHNLESILLSKLTEPDPLALGFSSSESLGR